MMEEKNNNSKTIFIFALIAILIGFGLVFSDYFLSKRQKVYDEVSLVLSSTPEIIESDDVPEEEDDVVLEETENLGVYRFSYETESSGDFSLTKSYYVGKLIIPKIHLARGFASKESSYNNVNKEITIITPSDYPDVVNGNFIVAGHAGHAWNTYFRDLRNLVIGDEAQIYYNNSIYVYKLVNIYDEPRGSNLKIYRDTDKTTLTLITCSMSNKKKQTIYIFER